MMVLTDPELDVLFARVPTMRATEARTWYYRIRNNEVTIPAGRVGCALQVFYTKARYADPQYWHKQHALACPDCHRMDYVTVDTRYHCRACGTSWTNDALAACWTPLTRVYAA